MSKELRPVNEDQTCDGCGRTILKGERTEAYLAPGGQRKTICELCMPRAKREGWIRESVASDTPAPRHRGAQSRGNSLLGKLFRGRRRPAEEAEGVDAGSGIEDTAPPAREAHVGRGEQESDEASSKEHATAADPRHVRAVPTNAEVKISRALDLFNQSAHPRTIAGIARSLGEPNVRAQESAKKANEILVTIAWELSWYRFVVDLAGAGDPVRLDRKGHELDELSDEDREWNAVAAGDGRLQVTT